MVSKDRLTSGQGGQSKTRIDIRVYFLQGPIVRINPFELSIRDPEYYDQLYVAGSVRPTDNYSTFARGVAFDGES